MGPPANRARVERAERRAIVALLAVFALLVQALAPAMASAASAPDGATVICTAMGLQTAPDGGAPAPSHSCKHCLCPAPATTPPSAAGVTRVAYVVAHARALSPSRTLPPPARAPPRPPGQGPPLFQTA